MARKKRKCQPRRLRRNAQQNQARQRSPQSGSFATPPATINQQHPGVGDGGCNQEYNKNLNGVKAMVNWDLTFAAVLVVCAVIEATVGIWQWNIMKANTQQTSDSLDLMRLERRPWLHAGLPVGVNGESKRDFTAFSGIIPVINSGATPAWLTSGGAGAVFQMPGSDIEGEVKRVFEESKSHSRNDVIAPSVTMRFHLNVRDIQEGMSTQKAETLNAAVESGQIKFYVVGRWTYRDTFGKDHYLECCFLYDPSTKGFMALNKYNAMN